MSGQDSSLDRIELKLSAARTRLILDKPFLGALVLRLPLAAADPDWCPTTATDAKQFYYNPDYIEGLSLEQTQFMLAHEALHCALSHFARRQHRVKHRWDLACDYAINPLLLDEQLTPPPNALWLDEFKGLTAEEIYPLIEEDDQLETLDRHVYDSENQQGSQSNQNERDLPSSSDPSQGNQAEQSEQSSGANAQPKEPQQQQGGGSPQPQPLTPDEQEMLNVQWQQRLAGAAQQALQVGKLGAELARLLDHLLQPQLPWQMLLARYMTAIAHDDYSYHRPSRREGEFILPRLHSHQANLVVAVDMSGSIKQQEMDAFLSEINAIKGQMRARITLLPCDAKLAEGAPWYFEPWEDFQLPQDCRGGGGTDFRPVFDWLYQQGMTPELLVYFTDAEGEFPQREPDYPVIWLVKGRLTVPWGQRIQLN